MAKNFRSTREFREAMLEALGTTQDKDVENEVNFKSALLEALGVEHTRSDVVNFETYREKLVEGVENYSGGGGGESDFTTAEVTINAPASFELTWGSCPMLLDGALNGSLYVGSLPATITVPLYNGKCVWDHNTNGLTLSGNIEKLYEGEAMLITGDCTITIS